MNINCKRKRTEQFGCFIDTNLFQKDLTGMLIYTDLGFWLK